MKSNSEKWGCQARLSRQLAEAKSMIKRQERIERMVSVASEYRAVLSAVELLQEQLRRDPRWGISYGWRAHAGDDPTKNLESTYIVRLYAEFESGLRWTTLAGMSIIVRRNVADWVRLFIGREKKPTPGDGS